MYGRRSPARRPGSITVTPIIASQSACVVAERQVFARYLEDPWYSLLSSWDDIDLDEDGDSEDEGQDGAPASVAEVEVAVRRAAEESFRVIYWKLSLHNGQWLIEA